MAFMTSRKFTGIGQSATLGGNAAQGGAIPTRTLALISLMALSTSLTVASLLGGNGDAALLASWLCCMLCASVMFITSKKISHAIFKALGLALTLSFFGYPMIPAIIFGGVISVGALAALICSAKGSRISLIVSLPVVSYALSFAVTADPLIALSALSVYLPAIPIGLTSRFKGTMTTSTVAGASVLSAMIAGLAALTLYGLYGEISAAVIDSIIEEFTAMTIAYTKESFALVEGVEYTPAIEKALILGIDTTVNILVGLVIALCTCASYCAVKLKNNLFSAYGVDEHLSVAATTLSVSISAAAIFSLSFVLSFALDSANRSSLLAVICTNVCIILAPGLALMGVRAIKAAPKRFGAGGVLLSFALTLAIAILFIASPLLLSLVGAIYIILRAIDLWAKDFYGKGENQ